MPQPAPFASSPARSRPPRRVRASLAALVAVLALTVGCAPLGPAEGVRAEYRQGASYDVPAGGTLFLRSSWSLGELDLTPADVRAANLNWIPLGIRGESANAAPLVTITPPQAPEGWRVRLWEARVVREVPLGAGDDASAVYRIDVELRVDVPEEAFDLTRRVRTHVVARDGGEATIDVLVRAL
jgi:hypothetical protein